MDTLLAGMEGIGAYLDDIIVSGGDSEQHLQRLSALLDRLEKANLKVKRDKCIFAATSMEFLGYHVDGNGVSPTSHKVQAILGVSEPRNKRELQSFLGMISFYDKFLPDRATVADPLYRLLDKNSVWSWGPPQRLAWSKLKQMLSSSEVLAHYDDSRQLLLSCDASPYGVGAVLSQRDDKGQERPVAYASRTLGKCERNYAQLDKEGLAILFGLTHFHQYVAGRKVLILTDHKPLLGIMGHGRPIPQVLSPRMLRWCLKLNAYDYELHYRPGSAHQNADALSRLPLASEEDEAQSPGDILLLEAVNVEPLTAEQIARLTATDPVLAVVYKGLQSGSMTAWKDDAFKPFRNQKAALSIHRGCVLRGSRVILPQQAREAALKLLHANHPGMSAMKACARSHFWWPHLDKDIEECARLCDTCQRHAAAPRAAPIPLWNRPTSPWEVVHMDFAGPIQGVYYLVVVDAHTKWVEVKPMRKTTTSLVLDALRSIFATFGLPHLLVTDNAPNFVSREMDVFCKRNGIKHITSAPYHPASNGQAERMVAETKRALHKLSEGSVLCRISRFLYKQHSTVGATGKTPAELMFQRHWSTVFDRMHPPLTSESATTTQEQKNGSTSFSELQPVYMRNFTGEPKWLAATILKPLGVRSYLLETPDGLCHRRHVDHIRSRSVRGGSTHDEVPETPAVAPSLRFPDPSSSSSNFEALPFPGTERDAASSLEAPRELSGPTETDLRPETAVVKRPQRQRKAPERYGFEA